MSLLKSIHTIMLFCCFSAMATAQTLKFRPDGSFRIAQFTDLHYESGTPEAQETVAMIVGVLDAESPDVVVFTGDVVVSAPSLQGWDEVLQTVIDRKIPYLVTLGNHDDESEVKRHEVADYVIKKPHILHQASSLKSVDGFLNDAVVVRGQSDTAAALLYAMDSKAYSTNDRVGGYGWFARNQVNWFSETSAAFQSKFGQALPALAFFHIPLPEYKLAFDDLSNKRLGVRYEKECAPEINTGMYAAMFEAGDVLGTFVGHDHVNDYLVDYRGIALAYGCNSRGGTGYRRTESGARIIVLQEGIRGFETYLREGDGDIHYRLNYPFPAKKK